MYVILHVCLHVYYPVYLKYSCGQLQNLTYQFASKFNKKTSRTEVCVCVYYTAITHYFIFYTLYVMHCYPFYVISFIHCYPFLCYILYIAIHFMLFLQANEKHKHRGLRWLQSLADSQDSVTSKKKSPHL